MKLTKNGASFQIVLPKEIVTANKWKAGDNLKAVIKKKGEIILKKEDNSKKLKSKPNSVKIRKKTWNRLMKLKKKFKKDNPDYFKEKLLDKFKE